MTSNIAEKRSRERKLMEDQLGKSTGADFPAEPDEGWWAAVLADEPKIEPQDDVKTPVLAEKITHAEPAQTKSSVNWFRVREIYAKDEIMKLEVVGYNRGGVLVSGDDIHGFVPASHLIDLPADHKEEDREQYLISYLGRLISLKVIECVQQKERIVFSERAALAEEGQRKHLLNCLKEGDVTDGVVTNITNFGAFIDLGGLEGLAHISELSWGRVKHPSEILSVGQEVKVMIIQVSEEQGRIALSLKRLSENPWEAVAKNLSQGDLVEVTISNIVKYGAFARLDEGIEGLIHVSSMRFPSGCTAINDFLHQGQQVTAIVLNLNPQKRRLGLRLESFE